MASRKFDSFARSLRVHFFTMNSFAVSSALLASSLLCLPSSALSQDIGEAIRLSAKPPAVRPVQPPARTHNLSTRTVNPARPRSTTSTAQNRPACHGEGCKPQAAPSKAATPTPPPLVFSVVGGVPAQPPRKPQAPDTALAPAPVNPPHS